jgi:segregation and condensation protein A
MPLEPVAIVPEQSSSFPVGGVPFEVRLPVFEGPLQLLLHLIESRQLDILSVPLAEVADAYVDHLTRHPVDASNLSEFVAVAAQLILLKSRRLLPGDPPATAGEETDEPDEEQLRQRLIEYRAIRNAARWLGSRDMLAPLMRREPRESDLPEAPAVPLPLPTLLEALDRLAAAPEPDAPPTEVVAREITIGMQIRVLLDALSESGRVILQAVLAGCRSRSEAAVTVLAMLELARRRQVRLEQSSLFGPILVTSTGATS